MSYRAGIFKDYNKNFVLDESKLRKIVNVVREHSNKLDFPTLLKFRVYREGDAFYETDDIDSVFNDDNAPGRAIKELAIRLYKQEEQATAVLNSDPDIKKPLVIIIFNRFDDDKVSFLIEAENKDWCFVLSEDIDAQIKRLLRRSSVLRFFPVELIDYFILLFFIGGFMLYFSNIDYPSLPVLTPDQIQKLTVEDRTQKILEIILENRSRPRLPRLRFLFVSLASIFIITLFISFRPFAKIFENLSRSVFYWGDMMSVHDALERRITHISWGVIIAFIVSLIATIVGGIALK